MLPRNITKFFVFVIGLGAICQIFFGCSLVSSINPNSSGAETGNPQTISSDSYSKPQVVGTIRSDEITESSGIAASRCNDGVLWTHNDSGGKNFIFAINEKGEKLGTWQVGGATNNDWEDIAAVKDQSGRCFLYIGDIGNNERLKGEMAIYRIREPAVTAASKTSSKKAPLKTELAETLRFIYPDIQHDAETMMVHPTTGDIYIVTKRLTGAAGVYKLKADFRPQPAIKLQKIGDISVPALPNGFLTGGDISPDGKRVVICDYFAAYEMILPTNSKDFNDIWSQRPARVELGPRDQGEAVCYSADGKAIFATSEKKNSPVIKAERK